MKEGTFAGTDGGGHSAGSCRSRTLFLRPSVQPLPCGASVAQAINSKSTILPRPARASHPQPSLSPAMAPPGLCPVSSPWQGFPLGFLMKLRQQNLRLIQAGDACARLFASHRAGRSGGSWCRFVLDDKNEWKLSLTHLNKTRQSLRQTWSSVIDHITLSYWKYLGSERGFINNYTTETVSNTATFTVPKKSGRWGLCICVHGPK